MVTIHEFWKKSRSHWELYVFPIILCLAISALFVSNDTYVYTTKLQVQNKKTTQQNNALDTLSLPVYQTIIKNPQVIKSARDALSTDYNIKVSQNDLVSVITTKPVTSGNIIKISATYPDGQLAVAMGKQVTKSMYYTLKTYLPGKIIRISPQTTLRNSKGVNALYAIVVSVLLGSALGLSVQLWLEQRSRLKLANKKGTVRNARS